MTTISRKHIRVSNEELRQLVHELQRVGARGPRSPHLSKPRALTQLHKENPQVMGTAESWGDLIERVCEIAASGQDGVFEAKPFGLLQAKIHTAYLKVTA